MHIYLAFNQSFLVERYLSSGCQPVDFSSGCANPKLTFVCDHGHLLMLIRYLRIMV